MPKLGRKGADSHSNHALGYGTRPEARSSAPEGPNRQYWVRMSRMQEPRGLVESQPTTLLLTIRARTLAYLTVTDNPVGGFGEFPPVPVLPPVMRGCG